MRELFERFFSEFVVYEKDYIKMDCEIVKGVDRIVECYATKGQKDDLKDTLYNLSGECEREGFLLGAKYATKLLLFLLSD